MTKQADRLWVGIDASSVNLVTVMTALQLPVSHYASQKIK